MGAGLLEYLEDIIGTNEYIPDLEEQEKFLDEIAEDLTNKQLRLEEAQGSLGEL